MNKTNFTAAFFGGVIGALFVTNLFLFLVIIYIYSGIKFKSWAEKENGGDKFTSGEMIGVMILSPFLWVLNGIFFLVSSGLNFKFRSPIVITKETQNE